jgi:hypothetical protein
MADEDDVVRSLATFYGHSEQDAFAARDLLQLGPNDFAVRFSNVARFAKTFGLNIRSLAEFIAETGTGIEPWQVERLRGEPPTRGGNGDYAA